MFWPRLVAIKSSGDLPWKGARIVAVSSLTPLSAGVGYRLVKLGEIALDQAEEVLSGMGVKPRLFNVLMTVAANPTLSQREISRALGLDPNVMVGVIDELENEGLARRERSTVDRRRHVVVVTDKGMEILDKGTRALKQAERAFLARLTDEEQGTLFALAGRLLGLDGENE